MADISLHPESLRALEVLVENFGLEGLVMGLVHICNEKAEHSRTKLADDYEARLWERDSMTLLGAQTRLHR